MKVKEVPEKIYVCIPDGGIIGTASTRKGFPHQFVTDEYIRTDAFIDKAFEFFDEHLWKYIDVKNANCGTYIYIDGDKLKEDFKKYMKGE